MHFHVDPSDHRHDECPSTIDTIAMVAIYITIATVIILIVTVPETKNQLKGPPTNGKEVPRSQSQRR